MLSTLYGRATAFRRAWYARDPRRRRSLDRPVISVGNLVLGGSGKTPLVAALARMLVAAGERPAILSRGYRRREAADGVVVVSDGSVVKATPEQSGDEPYMLARALDGTAVLVSPDRYLAGQIAERRLGCTIHLLDDGFQHARLRRDVDLLIVGRGDLHERVLPLGRLREPLTAARLADAVLVPGTEEDVRAVASALGVETAFRLVTRYGELPAPPHTRVAAVAGIARPERFFTALRGLGYEVAREVTFRDHHWFTAADIDAVERAAKDAGADVVVTTEKDAVRLPDIARWAVLPMETLVEPADRFAGWLTGRLAAARRRRAEQPAPRTFSGGGVA